MFIFSFKINSEGFVPYLITKSSVINYKRQHTDICEQNVGICDFNYSETLISAKGYCDLHYTMEKLELMNKILCIFQFYIHSWGTLNLFYHPIVELVLILFLWDLENPIVRLRVYIAEPNLPRRCRTEPAKTYELLLLFKLPKTGFQIPFLCLALKIVSQPWEIIALSTLTSGSVWQYS